MNGTDRRHLQSLAGERDPELLLDGLLSLGGRWESRHRETEALLLYQSLLNEIPADTPGLDRVGRRSEALQGRGAIGARVEVAARRFFRQAADPAMIFGFMVAGGVASLARGAALAQLGARAPSFWTRGWQARALAGSTAFAAELPALVGATRLAHGLLGYEEGFGRLDTLPQEFAGAALFLGALKLSGRGARALAGRSAPSPAVLAGGTLTGIYAGHRLQESFGLRPQQDELNRWFDAGETFLQLRFGGRLASSLLGSRNPSLEVARRERLLQPPVAVRSFPAIRSRPLLQAAGESAFEEVTLKLVRSEVQIQAAQEELSRNLGSRATSVVSKSFLTIREQMNWGEPWLNLVRASQYHDIQGFELAMRRLEYAVGNSRKFGLSGSYVNWLSRMALDRAVQNQDQPRFDRLLRFLGEGGGIDQLEIVAAELEPRYRLFSENPLLRTKQIGELILLRSTGHGCIRALPLHREARQALHAYARLLGNEAERVESAEGIRSWLLENSEHKGLVESALMRARLNPVGALRTMRLVNTLVHEPSNLAKLRELNDADLVARGRAHLIPALHQAEVIAGSQDDGYLSEPELTPELSELYRRMPELLNPRQEAIRQARTREILEEVWPSNRVPFDAERIGQALSLFGDPLSESLARDLAQSRFRLVILSHEELVALRRRLDPTWRGEAIHGLFMSANRDPSGVDSIYLQRPGPASHAVHRDLSFNAMAYLVHEWRHFRRADRQTGSRGLRGTYLEEIFAEAQMFRWRAEQGDARWIRHYLEIHPGGFGLFLRDWANFHYFVRENDDL